MGPDELFLSEKQIIEYHNLKKLGVINEQRELMTGRKKPLKKQKQAWTTRPAGLHITLNQIGNKQD